MLPDLIDYIYTGNLELEEKDGSLVESAVLLLQAETLLQLNDAALRTKLENILISDLRENETLDNVLQHWNYSVLFDLKTLMQTLQSVLDLKLETFFQNKDNEKLFALLGFEVNTKII